MDFFRLLKGKNSLKKGHNIIRKKFLEVYNLKYIVAQNTLEKKRKIGLNSLTGYSSVKR